MPELCFWDQSCWKIQPCFIFSALIDGMRFLPKISAYMALFMSALHRPQNSYLVWWFGSFSCCTGLQPAASRGATRGPWSFSDSKVCASAPQTAAPAETWCPLVASGCLCSSPPQGSSFAKVGRWKKPKNKSTIWNPLLFKLMPQPQKSTSAGFHTCSTALA